MFVATKLGRADRLGALTKDEDTMLKPKWLVFGALLIAFALIANYDLQLGMAAGALVALIAAIYVWIRVRLALADREPGASRRGVAVERFRKLTQNRRRAQSKDLSGEN